jgi:hypothetical protein
MATASPVPSPLLRTPPAICPRQRIRAAVEASKAGRTDAAKAGLLHSKDRHNGRLVRRRLDGFRAARSFLVPVADCRVPRGRLHPARGPGPRDAGHRQILATRTGNDILGFVYGNLLVGLSFGWWIDKHNRHFAPNHKGVPIVPAGIKTDFLRRQVLASHNVRGGRITDFVLGGLNYQIEHHLFPSMPRPNLRRAQALIRSYCHSHDVAYRRGQPPGCLRPNAALPQQRRQRSALAVPAISAITESPAGLAELLALAKAEGSRGRDPIDQSFTTSDGIS